MNSFDALVPRALGSKSDNEGPVLTVLRALKVDYTALHLLTREMINAPATYQGAGMEMPPMNVLLALQRVVETAVREEAQRKAQADVAHTASLANNGGREFHYRRDLRRPKAGLINNLQRYLRTSGLFDRFPFERVGGPANGNFNNLVGTGRGQGRGGARADGREGMRRANEHTQSDRDELDFYSDRARAVGREEACAAADARQAKEEAAKGRGKNWNSGRLGHGRCQRTKRLFRVGLDESRALLAASRTRLRPEPLLLIARSCLL